MIETERLHLRRYRLDDFPAYVAMWADPSVVEHIGGNVFPREASWQRFQRHFGHWELMGYGFWAVEDRDGKFCGECGFLEGKRELDPPLTSPEIGWALLGHARGKGLATEAVRASLAWGDANIGGRFVCMIDPDNAPSQRVATKCGFREYARTAYKGEPTILFERV